MKKLIDIPEKELIELKVMAARANIPLKTFIELELVKIANKKKQNNAKKEIRN